MLKIKEFTEKYLEDAANLFQKDYSALRNTFKILPARYETTEEIIKLLKQTVGYHPSVVATDNGRLVGYMTGYSGLDNYKGSFGGAYLPEWGHATLDLNTPRNDIYEDLYQAMAKEWVHQKAITHLISFLITNDVSSIFSWFGFGMQVIEAIREPEPIILKEKSHEFNLRLACEEDIPQLRKLDQKINAHLEDTPIFLYRKRSLLSDEDVRTAFLGEDIITIVAVKGQEIVSCIRGVKQSGNIKIVQDVGNVAINFAYTKKGYRNAGIGALLINELCCVIKQEEFKSCTVDFESQNIEGKYFWLKHFSPICYSMMRKLDDRHAQSVNI